MQIEDMGSASNHFFSLTPSNLPMRKSLLFSPHRAYLDCKKNGRPVRTCSTMGSSTMGTRFRQDPSPVSIPFFLNNREFSRQFICSCRMSGSITPEQYVNVKKGHRVSQHLFGTT